MKLEMLWERCEPDEVLRTRFHLTDSADAARWVSAAVKHHWGIRTDACERIVMSDHNALAWVRTRHGRMLLKWSVAPHRFARLGATASVVAWLGGLGLPVSAPVPAEDGRVQVERGDVSMGLQRHIGGALLDVKNRQEVWEAGATLARLHDALQVYPHADLAAQVLGSPDAILAQMTGWLASSNSAHLPAHVRDAFLRLVESAPTESLSVQVVHGDYRAANILCHDTQVVGVLDFEEARCDHRIVELARSAVLLGTLFHDWGPVSRSVRQQLLAGYESVHQLDPVEARWWDVLVLWYSLALVPPGEDPTGWGAAALEQLAQCR